MLTLEQVQELRRLADAGKTSRQLFEERFLGSWSALLDAAERVARQVAYAAEPDGYDSPKVHEAHAARQRADRDAEVSRRGAEALAADLEAECLAEFRWRPFVSRGTRTTDPQTFGPEDVEAWYAARGVVVQVEPDEADRGRLQITPIRLR